MGVITYPCWDLNVAMLVKGAPDGYGYKCHEFQNQQTNKMPDIFYTIYNIWVKHSAYGGEPLKTLLGFRWPMALTI